MAQATILGYSGNANLAGNSGSIDLSGAIPALRDVAMRINEVKDAEYKQKITDRDTVFKMISNLELDFDKVLPEVRDGMRSQIDEIEKDLLTNPDILNDREAYSKVQAKISKFNEMNAYAKTNYKTITEDLSELSKVADPEKRNRIAAYIQEQRNNLKKNPYDLYKPKDVELAVDINKIMPVVKDKKVLVKTSGLESVYRTYTPPEEMIKQWQMNMVDTPNATIKNQWDLFTEAFLSSNKDKATKIAEMNQWNSVVKKANEDLPDGQKIKEIPLDANGNPDFTKISRDDFQKAAYIGFRYKSNVASEFDKDELEKQKGLAEIRVKNADAAYKNAQRKQVEQKMAIEGDTSFEESFIDDTQRVFREFSKSATHNKKSGGRIELAIAGLSDQDIIGLGIKPTTTTKKIEGKPDSEVVETPTKVIYDQNKGVFNVIGESGVLRTVSGSDYLRNSIKDFYSTKMKVEDGVIDENKLELKVSTAIGRALKNRNYASAEDLNYTYGGMAKDSRDLVGGYKQINNRIYSPDGTDVTKYGAETYKHPKIGIIYKIDNKYFDKEGKDISDQIQ